MCRRGLFGVGDMTYHEKYVYTLAVLINTVIKCIMNNYNDVYNGEMNVCYGCIHM